jgi:glycosyltransferase involved in cell wall biosynthesis
MTNDKKGLKLLFVVNVDWFFLSHRLPIAIKALEMGYEVHIATGLTTRKDELISYGLVVHPLNINRSSTGLLPALMTFVGIVRVYLTTRPALVHLVTIKPTLFGGIAARLAMIPGVVVAVSGLGFVFVAQGIKAKFRRFFVGLLYRIALGHGNSHIIFQNDNDRDCLVQLAGLDSRIVTTIPGSGVDLDEYSVREVPEGVPIIMLAARLLADKGVREFVDAARTILAIKSTEGPVVRFVLVGDIDESNPTSITEGELLRWKAEGIVELWGHQVDMPKVLSQAYIVVLPSYYGEGLPKVLIEAAACGRAVVTTDHPGCREAIENQVSGILVPIRDSDALADAILRLLQDRELGGAMGKAGRRLAERSFGVERVVATHMRIYDELLAKC